MKSNPLVQLLYAVEATGYATVGSCETSAEWQAATIAPWRKRRGAQFARLLTPASRRLASVALAMLLVFI